MTTDGIKTKNPTVTTNLSFSGKYVVLTHGKMHIGISNKLSDKMERERLREVCKKFPKDACGYIVRTNAANIDEGILMEEAQTLFDLYQQLKKQGFVKVVSLVFMREYQSIFRIFAMVTATN